MSASTRGRGWRSRAPGRTPARHRGHRPPGRTVHTRHAVEEFAQRCAGVRNGAGVDADDPLGAEMGDQSRHRRAGTERDNDMVKVGQLGEELDGAVHVTTGGVGVGATERDDMRDSAIVSHLLGLALDLAVHLLRRGVTRPDELGAGQLIQYEVATVDVGLLSWLLCGAPVVITVVAPAARACAQVYCSLRTLLPPPPSPLRSSRLSQRASAASPTAAAKRVLAPAG